MTDLVLTSKKVKLTQVYREGMRKYVNTCGWLLGAQMLHPRCRIEKKTKQKTSGLGWLFRGHKRSDRSALTASKIICALLVCLLNSLSDILESEIDVVKVREKMRERVERWLLTLVDGKMADDGG